MAVVPSCRSLFVGSRKNPHPPHGWSLKFPGGVGGGSKAQIFQGKYEAKLKFPEGLYRRFKLNTASVGVGGRVDIF